MITSEIVKHILTNIENLIHPNLKLEEQISFVDGDVPIYGASLNINGKFLNIVLADISPSPKQYHAFITTMSFDTSITYGLAFDFSDQEQCSFDIKSGDHWSPVELKTQALLLYNFEVMKALELIPQKLVNSNLLSDFNSFIKHYMS